MTTPAQLVIEQLADDLNRAEADIVAYREALLVALEQWHFAEDRVVAVRAQLEAVKVELRRYTSSRCVEGMNFVGKT